MLSFQKHTSPGRRCSSVLVFCALLLQAPLSAATILAVTTIDGSVHDLSGSGVTIQICDVCHTPHANNSTPLGPLWNHQSSTAVYTLYISPTMDVPAEQPCPGSSSRLCLSCHDGTISIGSFGGNPGTADNTLTGLANKVTDLSDDHPIGIRWEHQTQGNGTSTQCFNSHDVLNLTALP